MGLAFASAEVAIALAIWLIAFNGYRTSGPMTVRVKIWLTFAGIVVTAVIVPNVAVELFDVEDGARAVLIVFATLSLFVLTTWFLLGGLRPEGSSLPGQRAER